MKLVQAWIYEHFLALSPHPSLDYTDAQPRMHRWSPYSPSRTTMDHLVVLRESLDVLRADEVCIIGPFACIFLFFYIKIREKNQLSRSYHPSPFLFLFII